MKFKFLRLIRILNYKLSGETKSKILKNLKVAYEEIISMQQNDSYDELIFLNKNKGKKRSRNTFKKMMVGFSGLAALLLVFVLVFSTHSPKNLLASNPKSGQFQSNSNKKFNPIKEQTFLSASKAVNSITTLEQTFAQSYPSDTLVNLGLGIKANYFAGSGYFKYKWNEGRWTILLAGRGDSATGTQTAKNVVAYLHTHSLPAPDQKGVITILLPNSSKASTVTQNTISRQFGNTVYTLKQSEDPIKSFQTVVNSISNINQSNSTIRKQTFSNATKASNSITTIEQTIDQTFPSGTQVNLGLGIKTIFSEGEGHYKYIWYEGRWTVIFVGWGDTNKGTQVAKNMVSYLHTHYLPAPDQKGVIMVLQPSSSKTPLITQNTISRQVGNKVYTLKQTGNPIKALQTVVNDNN
jgi:hypothetical protein